MKYNKISKKSKLYVKLLIFLITTALLILLGILNIFFHNFSFYIQYLSFIVFVLYLICIFFLPNIVYSNYEYSIDNEKVISIYGIIFINKKIVLLKNIYKIIIKMSPFGRILGLYSLVLATSAGNVKINFLDDDKIDELFYKILNT